MKRNLLRSLFLFTLVFSLMLSLFSCGGDGYYAPIKSSRLERTVIAETEAHEIKYELIRYLFMTQISTFDGGDHTLWQGEGADALWDAAAQSLMQDICDIYAVFDVCTAWGIDPNGEDILEMVNEYIKADIDGGYVGNTRVNGCGSVEAYKQLLKDTYCTDAVRRLLYQYSACLTRLYDYLAVYGGEGKLTVTDEELEQFLLSDDCAHFNRVFIPYTAAGVGSSFEEARAFALDRIETLRSKAVLYSGNYSKLITEVFCWSYSGIGSFATDEQIENGIWLGRNAANDSYSEELCDAIFETGVGQVSDIIETEDGFYFIYGMAKTLTPLEDEDLKASITSSYIEQLYYTQIILRSAHLFSRLSYTKDFDGLSGQRLMEGK